METCAPDPPSTGINPWDIHSNGRCNEKFAIDLPKPLEHFVQGPRLAIRESIRTCHPIGSSNERESKVVSDLEGGKKRK